MLRDPEAYDTAQDRGHFADKSFTARSPDSPNQDRLSGKNGKASLRCVRTGNIVPLVFVSEALEQYI
jgi:hypothetical protein